MQCFSGRETHWPQPAPRDTHREAEAPAAPVNMDDGNPHINPREGILVGYNAPEGNGGQKTEGVGVGYTERLQERILTDRGG